MPNFIDALGMKSGSTEVSVLSTARVLDNITFGSDVREAVVNASTASAAVATYGVVYFTPTTAPQAYDLPMPTAAGANVTYFALSGNTTDTITLACTAANLINGKYKTIVFNTAGQVVELVGLSTVLGWAVKSIGSTGIGMTTSLPLFTS